MSSNAFRERTAPPERSVSPAVQQVIDAIPDASFRERLSLVQRAAAQAIRRLREIELTRIEALAISGEGTDLTMWEEVAPALGASIGDVNNLLAAIAQTFPMEESEEDEDDFDLAFGGASDAPEAGAHVPTTFEEKATAAERAVQGIAQSLRFEVGRFGRRVRNPTIVADRWNLLMDLQEFRGKCRAAIGELVYSSCSAFYEISRANVIPEYLDDLQEALAVRQGWASLKRALTPLNAELQAAPVAEQEPILRAIQAELGHHRDSRGYLHMRAGDKRAVIQFSRELDDVLRGRSWGPQTKLLVEGFSKFLDSLAVLNRREVLMNHDREAQAECGRLLERASRHLDAHDTTQALAHLGAALKVAARLYGRDPSFDEVLLLRTRWPVENVAPAALGAAIEGLFGSLAESGTPAGPLF